MNSAESSGTGANVGVVAMPEQAVVRASGSREEHGDTVRSPVNRPSVLSAAGYTFILERTA